MNVLPPLKLLKQWREAGMTPQEIYARCEAIGQKLDRKTPYRQRPDTVTFEWRKWLRGDEAEEIRNCPVCKTSPAWQGLCKRHYSRLFSRAIRAKRVEPDPIQLELGN